MAKINNTTISKSTSSGFYEDNEDHWLIQSFRQKINYIQPKAIRLIEQRYMRKLQRYMRKLQRYICVKQQ